MKTKVIAAAMSVLACVATTSWAAPNVGAHEIEAFRLQDVRVTSTTLLHAQMLAKDYLLGLDADRLLAPYYKEAGLQPLAPNYPNWEDTGLDGHIGGHYVSALSYMYAATGDARVKERLDYMVANLAKVQAADGYLSGVVGGHALWQEVFLKKEIRAGAFSLNDRWVPLYNIHKIMGGLRDAYTIAGVEQARPVFVNLCRWFASNVANLSDDQVQQMLISEYGGLNEIMVDAYAVSGDTMFLTQARRLTHKVILDPLLKGEDKLDGLHANTQIPKIIGVEAVACAAKDADWAEAVNFFWHRVVDHRSVTIGGNSVREHFNPADDFNPMIVSEQGPETCNTYNMLRLTKMMFLESPSSEFVDFYERAMLNHILSTINSVQGGFVYFTPMRPGHYRVYSQPQTSFWCCVGSGLENHSRYGEMIYAHSKDKALYVNMFIPSVLNWNEAGVSVEQIGNFPFEEKSTIVVNAAKAKKFTMKIRKPAWAKDFSVSVGNKTYSAAGDDGYVAIERKWGRGDTLKVNLPMSLEQTQLPDGSNYYSFTYGPLVLAADLGQDNQVGLYADASRGGHIAAGPKMRLDEVPSIVTSENALAHIHKVGDQLKWTVDCALPAQYSNLSLVPFVDLSEHRYQVYFQELSPEGYDAQLERLRQEEIARKELDDRTIDLVISGEQQPESDHGFKEGSSFAWGDDDGTHWRETGSWFSYNVKVDGASKLSINIWSDGGREAVVIVDDKEVGTLEGSGRKTVDINLNGFETSQVTVRIVAKEGKLSPRVYEVRAVK